MKKIFISDYDISKFFGNSWVGEKGNTIHLIFIENKGYVLIHEKGDLTVKYLFKSMEKPFFYSDIILDNSGENFYKMENELLTGIVETFDTDIFPNPEPLRKISKWNPISEYEKIIKTLFNSLNSNFESNSYANVKDYPSEFKNLILDPDGEFNKLLQNEPLTPDEFKAQKQKVKNELMNTLFHLNLILTENKNIQGFKDKDGKKIDTLITENQFVKMVSESISDVISSPIFNLRYGLGKERINYINSIDEVTENFTIKGIFKNNIETLYYYDDEREYYQELTEQKFKNMIVNDYGLKLLPKDYKTIYQAIPTTNKEDNNILVFKNALYDMTEKQELDLEYSDFKRKDYLSTNLIGYEIGNTDNIELLDFDEYVELADIFSPDESKSMTYTEEKLRQILIPKDDKNDNKLFIDFLQRFGSCILGKNKYKSIALYFGDGNNGKGILKLLFELIYNKKAYSLTPDTFTQNFNLKSFLGRKCILLDEVDETSLNDIKPMIKRVSSPESRQEQRAIYSDKNIVLKNYPNMFIFSNVLLDFKLDELALFERFDFLKLPNRFVTEKELDKPNTYLIDRNTEEKIKKDYEGLSWLISASIKVFNHMEENGMEYRGKQTIEETMDILLNIDYLTKFIKIYTEKDESLNKMEYVTNDEIMGKYQEYMEQENHIIQETPSELARKIGTTIKSVYHIQGKISDSEMYYKRDNRIASYQIRIKSTDEVNKGKNIQYKIIEENYEQIKYLTKEAKNVYDKIKQGKNTINLIKKDYPSYNVIDNIYNLIDLGLIKKSEQTSLIND